MAEESSAGVTTEQKNKTSQFYHTDADLPERFENPDWFQGYNQKKATQVSRYLTTNQSYGARPPCVHTMPVKYKPRSQVFSSHLSVSGMYRNNSLNTHTERSFVTGTPDPISKI